MDISYGAGNDTSLNPNLHLMQAGPAGGDITYSHGFRALCLCTCMEACKKTLEQRRFLHACHIQLCPNLIGIMMHAASCGAPLHQSFTLCPVRSLKLYRYVTNARTACRAQQQDMHVLAIPGSLRKASTNNGLIRAAVKLAPQGMQIDIADISKMPLYNDDLWQSGVPRSVTAFRDQIQAADALLFSVPEYNYSLPGPLKNAIDWASHPNVFAGKPGTMMGAGGGYGTGVGQLHLRQCAVWLEIHFLNKPSIQIHRFTEKGIFDDDGNLTSDKWEERLRTQLEALQQWTKQLQATPVA